MSGQVLRLDDYRGQCAGCDVDDQVLDVARPAATVTELAGWVETRAYRRAVRSVPCPTCAAEPGHPCTGLSPAVPGHLIRARQTTR